MQYFFFLVHLSELTYDTARHIKYEKQKHVCNLCKGTAV